MTTITIKAQINILKNSVYTFKCEPKITNLNNKMKIYLLIITLILIVVFVASIELGERIFNESYALLNQLQLYILGDINYGVAITNQQLAAAHCLNLPTVLGFQGLDFIKKTSLERSEDFRNNNYFYINQNDDSENLLETVRYDNALVRHNYFIFINIYFLKLTYIFFKLDTITANN